MTNHVVDNSIKNLGKAVLWQYDKAVRLLAIMKHIQVVYHCAIEQFWDYWTNKVLAMDTIGSFGCSLWGIFLGVPRPTVIDDDGTERLIVTSVYRRVLKGAFYFMKASCNFKDILGYLEIVFGISGNDNLSKWNVTVSEYGWTTNIDELNDLYEVGKAYSKDEVIWYHTATDEVGNNYKFTRDVTEEENTSWAAISGAVEKTNESTTGNASSDTMLLKLYDPEGICRKIGGSPKGSLSISLSYEFGNTTITAKAVRMRKCGITLTDNGDMTMTYGKSAYYDEMHRDQKKLFEQRIDEYCPYPLGIGSGEPVEEWVLGFGSYDAEDYYGSYQTGKAYKVGDMFVAEDAVWYVYRYVSASVNTSLAEIYGKAYVKPVDTYTTDKGQDNEKYAIGIAYEEGHIFGYVDSKGHGYNYKCISDISSSENVSFAAISSKLVKTRNGDPFVEGFSNARPPWYTIDTLETLLYHFMYSGVGISTRTCVATTMTIGGFGDNIPMITRKDNLDVVATVGNPSGGSYIAVVYPSEEVLSKYALHYEIYTAKAQKVIVCSTFKDFLETVYSGYENDMKINTVLSKSQASKYNSSLYYIPGTELNINGEDVVLTKEKWNIDERRNYWEYETAPKTTLISHSTLKTIGQVSQ